MNSRNTRKAAFPMHRIVLLTVLAAATIYAMVTMRARTVVHNQPNLSQFSFAAVGDQDYEALAALFALSGGTATAKDFRYEWEAIINDINAKQMPFTIHIGDMQANIPGGDSVCTAGDLKARRMRMEKLNAVVMTPGDNDWSECFQLPFLELGGYLKQTPYRKEAIHPLAVLKQLREEFYPNGQHSLGTHPISLERQDDYPENVRFMYGEVAFVVVHIVGGIEQGREGLPGMLPEMDGCPLYVYDPQLGPNPKVSNIQGTWGPAKLTLGDIPIHPLRDKDGTIDCSENKARKKANLEWLAKGYELAKTGGAKAIVVAFHADLHIKDDGKTVGAGHEIFQDYVDALRNYASAYPMQTLHIFGDSHVFEIDRPYKINNSVIPNVIRLQVFGSDKDKMPNTKWIKVNVDTNSDKVFTFEVCDTRTQRCTYAASPLLEVEFL